MLVEFLVLILRFIMRVNANKERERDEAFYFEIKYWIYLMFIRLHIHKYGDN